VQRRTVSEGCAERAVAGFHDNGELQEVEELEAGVAGVAEVQCGVVARGWKEVLEMLEGDSDLRELRSTIESKGSMVFRSTYRVTTHLRTKSMCFARTETSVLLVATVFIWLWCPGILQDCRLLLLSGGSTFE
jgi:hypothetical protein